MYPNKLYPHHFKNIARSHLSDSSDLRSSPGLPRNNVSFGNLLLVFVDCFRGHSLVASADVFAGPAVTGLDKVLKTNGVLRFMDGPIKVLVGCFS